MNAPLLSTRATVAAMILCAGSSASGDECPNVHPPIMVEPGFVSTSNVRVGGFSMDSDGTTLVIGDPYAEGTFGVSRSGAFSIHEHQLGGGWSPVAAFSGSLSQQRLGFSVAVRGGIVAVAGVGVTGRIYERVVAPIGATWNQTALINIPGGTKAVRIDGETVYAATRSSDNSSRSNIYEYTRTASGAWIGREITHEVRLASANGLTGWAVSGETMVCSFAGSNGSTSPSDVRVFRRVGANWAQEAVLSGRTTSVFDGFGIFAAIDGDTIAIGANWWPYPLNNTGYARVYRRATDGTWPLEAEFTHPTAPSGSPNSGFGMSVALRGETLVIGSMLDDHGGIDSGTLYSWQRIAGQWTSRASFAAANTPGAWIGWNVVITPEEVLSSAPGLFGVGGAIAFDTCSLNSGGGATPRCLPGTLGLITFANAFFAHDPFADYNLSGAISVQDFFDFMNDWFAGCL